jgi:hypothetical protein
MLSFLIVSSWWAQHGMLHEVVRIQDGHEDGGVRGIYYGVSERDESEESRHADGALSYIHVTPTEGVLLSRLLIRSA